MVTQLKDFFIVIFYRIKYKKKHVRFLRGKKIQNCTFEGFNSVGVENELNNCSLGLASYTGCSVKLNSVQIGRFCSLGSFIRNTTGRHPSSVFVSTHPSFFSKGKAAGFTFCNEQKFNELKRVKGKYLVEIGNDVWIGDNVLIMDGVTIGDGAIIGTGALVTKDIEPYSINVGIPAQPIKKRFTDEQIEFLLCFKWWNKNFEWIKKNWEKFDNMEKFIEQYNDEKN
ncbi:MAG: CatB-related O-acetyltransferase [Prevotellaceae bacterium]|jgi:acetyltransferase-like isoleucine patch superfamily enzyme|nr:CatB-related O-acetyltransferase [Prevotellaceae bacterium]